MVKKIILTTAYLASIQYYSKLLHYNEIFIEIQENFIKQSYRNRCKIYGANGELALTIPIKKDNPKTLTKDIVIDYDTNWRKLHWKSIESAYRSSPFFEFYEDDFRPFYEKKFKYLVDFNIKIQNILLEHLEINTKIAFTEDYIHAYGDEVDDFREKIHPKRMHDDSRFEPLEYVQVFQEKYGFIPNLSIIDLLFNEGPNAINILKNV